MDRAWHIRIIEVILREKAGLPLLSSEEVPLEVTRLPLHRIAYYYMREIPYGSLQIMGNAEPHRLVPGEMTSCIVTNTTGPISNIPPIPTAQLDWDEYHGR